MNNVGGNMENNKCEGCDYCLENGWCKFPICLKDPNDEKQYKDEADEQLYHVITDAMLDSWIKDDTPILVKQNVKEKLQKKLSTLYFNNQEKKYCHPIEKNLNKRYRQTGYFCSECGKMIVFFQNQCECGCLIDWNEIDDQSVKE